MDLFTKARAQHNKLMTFSCLMWFYKGREADVRFFTSPFLHKLDVTT